MSTAVVSPTKERLDHVLAPRATRLGAVLIDAGAAVFAAVPGFVMILVYEYDYDMELLGLLLMIGGFLGVAGYNIYLLSVQGQTIGKRALNIRIVREDDGTNPGFGRAVALRGFLPGAIGAIPAIGWIFSLANPLFIFGPDRRCIHDYIAGTCVIDLMASSAPGKASGAQSSEPGSSSVEEYWDAASESHHQSASTYTSEAPLTLEEFNERVRKLNDYLVAGIIDSAEARERRAILIERLRQNMVHVDNIELLGSVLDLHESGLLSFEDVRRIKDFAL
jgi:uncharacterized RDD family membrane protein YckC